MPAWRAALEDYDEEFGDRDPDEQPTMRRDAVRAQPARRQTHPVLHAPQHAIRRLIQPADGSAL
jgi:hypothetical protein